MCLRQLNVVVAGLDSRPDLPNLKPVEFEHLIRRLSGRRRPRPAAAPARGSRPGLGTGGSAAAGPASGEPSAAASITIGQNDDIKPATATAREAAASRAFSADRMARRLISATSPPRPAGGEAVDRNLRARADVQVT